MTVLVFHTVPELVIANIPEVLNAIDRALALAELNSPVDKVALLPMFIVPAVKV